MRTVFAGEIRPVVAARAMPPEVYSGMVLVSLVTALMTPLVLRLMLQRWQPSQCRYCNSAPNAIYY